MYCNRTNLYINLFERIAKHQHASIFAFEQEFSLNFLDVRVKSDNNST